MGLLLCIAISIAGVNFVKPLFSILLLAVDVIVVAIYHTRHSYRMRFMSPGEMIAGRINEDGKKR